MRLWRVVVHSIGHSARTLGIKPTALESRIKKLGLKRPR